MLFSHPDYLAGCADEIKASRDALCRELSALAGENPTSSTCGPPARTSCSCA
ncbi:MAG: hypothetical protein ACLVL7_03805 [Anaerotruncus massiliensis (ex Togo et al. 2019)]